MGNEAAVQALAKRVREWEEKRKMRGTPTWSDEETKEWDAIMQEKSKLNIRDGAFPFEEK